MSLLLLVSCSDEIPENPVVKDAGRTVLAYIVSNNKAGGNLDADLKKNVCDMYKGLVANKKASNLLVYYRPYPNDESLENPSILKFASDGKGHINGKPALVDRYVRVEDVLAQAEVHPYVDSNHIATDPNVMTKVFKDMIGLAPSKSYGLTFGSHGTGWLEGNSVQTRSFGDDNTYSIDIPELAQALKNAFTNEKVDYILFDACMMANAEVAYELRDVTDYCVGSVLETSVYGFPYEDIMGALFAENVNYQQICDMFIEFNKQKKAWGTCAAINCSKMQELADWVKVNLDVYKDVLFTDYLENVQQYGRGRFYGYSYDIVDVFRQMTGQEPDELNKLMDEVVVAKNCLSGEEYIFANLIIDQNRFCGMGMYLPYRINNEYWDTYYTSSLNWAKAVEWTKYRP